MILLIIDSMRTVLPLALSPTAQTAQLRHRRQWSIAYFLGTVIRRYCYPAHVFGRRCSYMPFEVLAEVALVIEAC